MRKRNLTEDDIAAIERQVMCATCEGWMDPEQEEIAKEDRLSFHPACRPDLVRCVWCGEWFQAGTAIFVNDQKRRVREAYHPACFTKSNS